LIVKRTVENSVESVERLGMPINKAFSDVVKMLSTKYLTFA